MKRIGIVASKISKGNLALYNLYVILIAFLFSSFVFIIAGAIVVFAITIIAYIGNEVMAVEFERDWSHVLALCMAALTIVIALFSLFAILKNIRLPKKKRKNGNS